MPRKSLAACFPVSPLLLPVMEPICRITEFLLTAGVGTIGGLTTTTNCVAALDNIAGRSSRRTSPESHCVCI